VSARSPIPGPARRSSGRTRRGDAILDDSPNTVGSAASGATHAASAWVRVPSGRTVTIRLRELSGTTVVHTSTPAAGGDSLSLEVVVSLATGTTANVDDVTLTQA
jgi:hypothetical protein